MQKAFGLENAFLSLKEFFNLNFMICQCSIVTVTKINKICVTSKILINIPWSRAKNFGSFWIKLDGVFFKQIVP